MKKPNEVSINIKWVSAGVLSFLFLLFLVLTVFSIVRTQEKPVKHTQVVEKPSLVKENPSEKQPEEREQENQEKQEENKDASDRPKQDEDKKTGEKRQPGGNISINEAKFWYQRSEQSVSEMLRSLNLLDRMWSDYINGKYPSDETFKTYYQQNLQQSSLLLMKIQNTPAIGDAQDFRDRIVSALQDILKGSSQRLETIRGDGSFDASRLKTIDQKIQGAYEKLEQIFLAYGVDA